MLLPLITLQERLPLRGDEPRPSASLGYLPGRAGYCARRVWRN
jgi:hypothetical protein